MCNIKIKNNKGFSLIELSIVLIIIGLLTIGITRGSSLIEVSRYSKFNKEAEEIIYSIYHYRSISNNLPGDNDMDGIIGVGSDDIYTSNYKTVDGKKVFIPNVYSAPFIDLYNNNYYYFEPRGNSLERNSDDIGVPYSKSFKDGYFALEFVNNGGNDKNYFLQNLYMMQTVFFHIPDDKLLKYSKIFRNIDTKFDTGFYNKGYIRSACDGSSGYGKSNYEDAINNNKMCNKMYFIMEDIH